MFWAKFEEPIPLSKVFDLIYHDEEAFVYEIKVGCKEICKNQ